MYPIRKYLWALSLGLLLASTTVAQQTPSRPFPQGNPQSSVTGSFGTPLFQNPNISQALGLTPQQRAQLNAANENLQSGFQRESGQLGPYRDPNRNARMQDLMRAYNGELMRSAAGIMTPQQLSRYQQLELQNKGFDAFADVDVQRRLNLNEAQLQRMQQIAERNNQQLQALMQNNATNPDEAQRRYDVWRQQTFNQANGVLTETQMRVWNQMIGQPFNMRPDFSNPGR
jgi:hypothetical protein